MVHKYKKLKNDEWSQNVFHEKPQENIAYLYIFENISNKFQNLT